MTAAELAEQLCSWVDRLFPDRDRGERLQRVLRERFGADGRAVTGDVCREIELAAQQLARHFELEYVADGTLVPDADPPGWPPQDEDEVRARAGSVGGVRRLEGGVGVLALDGLDPVLLAAPYVEAAFALLRGASAIVLDLRRNGGGDPGTVMLVLDRLLGSGPVHVSDVIYRDRTRQWWTAGLATPIGVPVRVLVSGRTYSSGEALAYHLQSRGRARVLGQRTPGAADHVTPIRVSRHVRAVVPEALVRDAVTGANWEGHGVTPDVACEPGEALEAALADLA